MNVVEWSMTDRVYLAIVDLGRTDRMAFNIYKRRALDGSLLDYAESIVKNPNQTQVAQRIYAHAVADRLDGK